MQRYLRAYGATILSKTENEIQVDLPSSIDTDLFPRPSLQWIQSQGSPPPSSVTRTLHLQPPSSSVPVQTVFRPGTQGWGNLLHSALQNGRFAHLREETIHPDLYKPWFFVFFHIIYQCDRKQSRITHWAISLTDGQMIRNAYSLWQKRSLHTLDDPKMMPHHPIPMSLEKAIGCLEEKVLQELEAEDHSWATKATQRFQKAQRELSRLSLDERELEQRSQENAVHQQPRIAVNVAAAALIYLAYKGGTP
nr:YqhG family protein [Pasteuria penetrans]